MITLLVILNLGIVNYQHEVTKVVLKDPSSYDQVLNEAFKKKEIKSLSIVIEENRSRWITFPIFEGIDNIENKANYSFERYLPDLPRSICELERLEELDLSFLGLEKLPECLSQLQNLKALDISFNHLAHEKVLELLSQLTSLEVLRIYGSHISHIHLQKMKSTNPRLVILFSKKDFLKEFED